MWMHVDCRASMGIIAQNHLGESMWFAWKTLRGRLAPINSFHLLEMK
jgi:hypothetical protein